MYKVYITELCRKVTDLVIYFLIIKIFAKAFCKIAFPKFQFVNRFKIFK